MFPARDVWGNETRPARVLNCESKTNDTLSHRESFSMTRMSPSRVSAMISLLGGLLLSTQVLAQTGGAGGSVNGGPTVSPSGVGAPALPDATPGTITGSDGTAPAPEEHGTYGGMGPDCPSAGPTCYPPANNPGVNPPPTNTPPH